MINSILKYLKNFVKSNISICLLFVIVAIFLYYPALHGGFIADDIGQIYNNPFIHSLKNFFTFFQGGTFYTGGYTNTLEGTFYRPLMVVSYAVLYTFFGLEPFYYHLSHLFLHVANAFLVLILFRKLLRNYYISFLLAFIFLIHPLNIEAVAYLADIQDTLFFFFGLLSLLFIMRESKKIPLISLLLLFIAMLSKESAILFFIIIFIYLDMFVKKYRMIYCALSVGIVGFYVYLRCGIAHICMISSNVPISASPWQTKLLTFPAIVLYYIKNFFYPNKLSLFQYWTIDRLTFPDVFFPTLITVLFFLGIFSVPFILYGMRKKLSTEFKKKWYEGNYSDAKIYAFFFLWLIVGLVFYSHIIPLDATVADRWFYFGIVGMLGLLGIALKHLQKVKLIYIVLIIWIIVLCVLGHRRILDWSDSYRLYKHDSMISKNSSSLENNFGALLFNQNKFAEAETHFLKASKLAPENPIFLHNLALVAEKNNDNKKAEYYYQQSIKIGRFYKAFEGYVLFLEKNKRDDEAIMFLEKKALKTFPHNKTLIQLHLDLLHEKK